MSVLARIKQPRAGLSALALLVLATWALAAPSAVAGPEDEVVTSTPPHADGQPREAPEEPASEAEPPSGQNKAPEPPSSQQGASPFVGYPNVCESFTVYEAERPVKGKRGVRYPVRYRRNRYARTKADQRRTAELIELVAREMGVKEPDFFVAFALHESSWNPEAIHILNPDRDAGQVAWRRHTYDDLREMELVAELERTSAQDKRFWQIKAKLADLRLYKGNPHWNDRMLYDYVIPERKLRDGTTVPSETLQESRNVWTYGYGLYGMYAVGFTARWTKESPPWVLCGDEGIIATVVQVWAARDAASQCSHLAAKNPEKWGSEGGTYYGSARRLARGHCSDKRLGKAWRKVMGHYSVPWDEKANFGTQWPKETTDRAKILAHMRKRAEEEGLLRPQPLKRKRAGTEPKIVSGQQVVSVLR